MKESRDLEVYLLFFCQKRSILWVMDSFNRIINFALYLFVPQLELSKKNEIKAL